MDLLKQLILLKEEEISAEKKSAQIDDLFARIAKDCGPFLDLKIKTPLYRGVDESLLQLSEFSKKRTHRTDRMPRDSAPFFVFMFNTMCEAATGFANVRERSLYCTPNKIAAADYGTVAYLIPAGEIKIFWSPKIADSTGEGPFIFNKLMKAFETNLPNSVDLGWSAIDYIRDIFTMLARKFTPTDFVRGSPDVRKEFARLIARNPEMAKVFEESGEDEVFNSLLLSLQDLADGLKYNLGDAAALKTAAKSQKAEIAIVESSGYYVLPAAAIKTEYSEMMKKIKSLA